MSQANEQLATNEVWRLNPLIWGCFLFGISYNINPVWMMGWIVATAPLHELGHGTAAWLASRLAIPTWVFHTAVWPGFSWAVFILVSLVLVAAYFHAHKYRAIFLAWMSGATLLIHLIFSTLSEHLVNGLVTAGGLAGESLLGGFFMSLPWIYLRAGKSTRLIVLSCLGAISLGHALAQWIGILVGVEPLPIGSLLFGTDHGDLNELSTTYKWSPNLIITYYLSFSILSTLYVTLCWWMCPAVHQSIDVNLAGGTSRGRFNPISRYDWVFRLWAQLLSSLYSLSSRSALSGENFFGMIYLIFMSDGKLDSNEADFLDHMSQKFHWMFPRSIKIKKMQSMRATRASGKPFTVFARNLVEESKGDKGTLRSALEYLVIAAGCNGRIEPKQTIMLEVACHEFGFTQLELNRIINEQFEFIQERDDEDLGESSREQFTSDNQQYSKNTTFDRHEPLGWAYRELGCPTNANSAQIKKRYRLTIKRLHPDALSGQKVNPKVARELAERFIKVQKAYEALEHAGRV